MLLHIRRLFGKLYTKSITCISTALFQPAAVISTNKYSLRKQAIIIHFYYRSCTLLTCLMMQYYGRPLSYFASVLCDNWKRQLQDLLSNLRAKKNQHRNQKNKLTLHSKTREKKNGRYVLYNDNASRVSLCNMIHGDLVNTRHTHNVTPVTDDQIRMTSDVSSFNGYGAAARTNQFKK